MPELTNLFDSFSDVTSLVIGDVMIDAYVWGKVDRISPEAPVPVLQASKRDSRLGGAANVALNIQALGATPILCAIIGDDDQGEELLSLMSAAGLSTDGIIKIAGRKTTVKLRVLSGSHHLLRIDSEDTHYLSPEDQDLFLSRINSLITAAQVVVFEDYDKGAISPKLIEGVVKQAREHQIPVSVDPKFKNFAAYKGVTLFKPNLKELREGLGIKVDPTDLDSLESAVNQLRDTMQIEGALITLSEHGMYLSTPTFKGKVKAHLRNIADVSGAGDTVISIASVCLALQTNDEMLLELANLGGGLVCEHVGVVPINKDDLLEEAHMLILAQPFNF